MFEIFQPFHEGTEGTGKENPITISVNFCPLEYSIC